MTSYSEYGGLVDYDPTRITTDEPVDTSTVRDGLINNAAHLVQSSTQQRVNWIAVSGAAAHAAGGGLQPTVSYSPIIYTVMGPVGTFGPFPMTVSPQGTSSKLVLRIAGRVGNGTATFVARVAPYFGRTSVPVGLAGTVNDAPIASGSAAVSVSTASNTTVWLTPSPTFVYISDPAEMARARTIISMPRSLGGDADSAVVSLCTLDIWASCTDPASPPTLDGVYAREFLG